MLVHRCIEPVVTVEQRRDCPFCQGLQPSTVNIPIPALDAVLQIFYFSDGRGGLRIMRLLGSFVETKLNHPSQPKETNLKEIT
jgi:hypothetical protein